ncbi:MAG: BREX system ATP-binding protein BrxD [Deltaproteobacteria bacterium]|nr:MAG: BREX system ATP-binding protein BrxD [Deltaproteobacteria bacterium]
MVETSEAWAGLSPQRREDIVAALARGVVPAAGLAELAVGLERLEETFRRELERVATGRGHFKAIRGEYGAGKTFCVRWLTERARRMGFATAEVQISETDTPLHRMETVYRRAMEHLETPTSRTGALADVVDRWFFSLEEDVRATGLAVDVDEEGLARAVQERMEARLAGVSQVMSSFAAALRGYHRAMLAGDYGTAQALLAWVAGQPNVGAAPKRGAGLKGEIDHEGALTAFRGVLTVLRDSGYQGLVLVLDEVETLQRVRTDVRDKSLNALRQLIDELDGERFPGLYVVITGTPAFFDGQQGIKRLEPLAQRLHVDWLPTPEFDNPEATQIRLRGLDREGLLALGRRVRDLFADGQPYAERVHARFSDAFIASLADKVTGRLGGRVGVTPRLFLMKLVNVLQTVAAHPAFDPAEAWSLELRPEEMTREEQAALGVDDVELEV